MGPAQRDPLARLARTLKLAIASGCLTVRVIGDARAGGTAMFLSFGRDEPAIPAADPHATMPDPGSELADEVTDPGEANAAGEWDGSEDFRFAVRPYTWTRGRTRPVQDLAFETLISTSEEGRDLTSICSAEHAPIAELCAEIRSVAEVAALLALPLGVARVLLADMIDAGLLHMHSDSTGGGGAPDLPLLERVLDGLYRL